MNVNIFIKNIIKYCIPSLVSALVGIVAIPLISHVYPASDYGKINLFYSVGNMILYIVFLGLDSAFIRFYFEQPQGANRKQLFSLAFWVSTVLVLVMTVLVLILAPDIISRYLFGEKNLKLIAALFIYILGLILFRLLSIETRMENQALRYNIQQVLLILSNRISFVLVAFFSTNYQFSIWVITVSTFLLAVFFFSIQKSISDLMFPRLKRNVLNKILLFSIPIMPTMVMAWINNSVAKIVLSGYNDFNSVGVFSIASSVANVFSVVPAAFTTYWSPFMYKNYKTQNQFIRNVHDYICFFSVLLILLIFCLQDVFYYIVGESYKTSQPYFMLIMMAPIQLILCETTSYGIVLSNKTKFNLYISIIALLFNVFTGVLLYNSLGIYGVVIGVAGSALIQLFLKTVIGQFLYKSVNNYLKMLLSVTLIVMIVSVNVFVYNNFNIRLMISFITLIILLILYWEELSKGIDFFRKRNYN